jgi:hypothetical protein
MPEADQGVREADELAAETEKGEDVVVEDQGTRESSEVVTEVGKSTETPTELQDTREASEVSLETQDDLPKSVRVSSSKSNIHSNASEADSLG